MSQLLVLQERVKNTISLGESHFREFKSALEGPEGNKRRRATNKICSDIGEALVAFANADGGELLIGVEDSGIISGISHGENEINQMLSAPKTHVHPDSDLPMIASTKLELENKIVLFFSVAKGTTEIYQLPDGRCVRRKDKSSMPETAKRIMFDRQEIKSREFDRQFVDGATVNDLDVSFVLAICSNYLKGLSVELYLQQIGLAEYTTSGLKLRMAALLLFAQDVQKWHMGSQVRILKVVGTDLKSGEHYNVLSDESVQGNIFKLIEDSWRSLRPFLAYKTDFGSDAKFEQRYIYPEGACREALINAIAHRDYSIHNSVNIFIFDDRLEIRSPGALLSTLTIKDLEELEGAHESRNALIARVLRENKFMRELGEGMKRIFQLMEESELEKPTLSSDTTSFSITLPHKSVFSILQEQWLLMFQQYSLTTLQKKIIVLGMNEREISPIEIYKAMNTDDRNIYDKEVTALRTAKLLVSIRSNPATTGIARRNKIPKSHVPRFKVQIPGVSDTTIGKESKLKEGRHNLADSDDNQGVFVAGLPDHITKQEIRELFETCGKVKDIHIPLNDKGRQRGFGFVWFYTEEAAKRAIIELDDYELEENLINVKKIIPKNKTFR